MSRPSPAGGGGHVFRCEVLVRPPGLEEPPLPAPPPGGRVLVAETRPAGRDALCRQLRQLGQEPAAVADSTALLAMLGEGFDCLIIDATIGPLDAIALAREVRRRPAPPPKIILLGVGEWAEGPRPFGLFDAMLPKPVLPERLRESLLCASQPREAAPPAAPRSGPAMHLLVVDDNTVSQFVMAGILEQAGIAASIAGNGLEALATETRLDAVLMDVQMPVMDGLAATCALRDGQEPNRATRIIGLTAAIGAASEKKCREAGMDDYLSKPVDREQSLRALGMVARG